MIYKAGGFAHIRKGWDREGTTVQVLGPPIEVNGLKWSPVVVPGEEDPDFHKTAGLDFTNRRRSDRRKTDRRSK